MDGVYLSASGIEQIQSLSMPVPKKPRQRRTPKKPDQPLVDPLVKHPNVARLLSMSSVDGEESQEKGLSSTSWANREREVAPW